MRSVSASELPHAPGTAGASDDWAESWTFDFARDDGTGGFVHLAYLPRASTARCWAYVVGPDLGLVAVRDHDVPLPRRAGSLEARADSLWVELVCETPLEHWSIGLEAFGLRYEDDADERAEIGERLPLGLDLEFEVLSPAVPSGDEAAGRYSQAGTMRGELLVGPERVAFDGTGVRARAWGPGDAWWVPERRVGACAGRDAAVEVVEVAGDTTGWSWTGGEVVAETALPAVTDELAVASVRLDAPAGQPAYRQRALCRATTGDGRGAVGWLDRPSS